MERRAAEPGTGKRTKAAPASKAGYPALLHVERRWVARVLGLALVGAALEGCPQGPAPAPDAGPRRPVMEKSKLQGVIEFGDY